MPKAAAASVLVVSAQKCLEIDSAALRSSLPPCARNQSRAECALTMVSRVVKDLDATRNKVLSGRVCASTWPSSCPSTFETKWKRLPAMRQSSSALTTMAGPRSEPPMPMLTMSVICGLARTCSASASICARLSCTSARASRTKAGLSGSQRSRPSAGWRSSQCMAARPSEQFTCAPANIASRACSRPQSRASCSKSCWLWLSIRFLDRSANRWGACWLNWSRRDASSAKAARRSWPRPSAS